MHINNKAPKFIVIPYEFVVNNALCNLSTYHHSYIVSILDTAYAMLNRSSFGEYELSPLEPKDAGQTLAHQIAQFIGQSNFNRYQIRLVGRDYILELWYEAV